MFNEWFPFLLRASLQLLISGSCVALLSRIYPLASLRWHRLAWGTVLLQGLVLVPFSMTIEVPEWLATHRFVSGTVSDSKAESAATGNAALPVAPSATRVDENAAEDPSESRVPPEISDARDVAAMEPHHRSGCSSGGWSTDLLDSDRT